MPEGRILLVASDASQRDLLVCFLQARGLDVDPVGSVEEARQRLEVETPAAVVTDFGLPDGSGMDVLRRARAVDEDLGVILITGSETGSRALEGMKEGALDALLEPVDPVVLHERIRRALRVRAVLDQNRRLRRRARGLDEDNGRDEGPTPTPLNDAIVALERRMICEALTWSGGVQLYAAARLGIAERVLRYKMKKYGIERLDFDA